MQEIVEGAVYDILDVKDAPVGALPLQTAALSLATKIAQALEGEAEDFLDKIIDFITSKIKMYSEALTAAGAAGMSADLTETWKAFFQQAGEYIVTLVTISPDAIAAHCIKFFPTICALLSYARPISPPSTTIELTKATYFPFHFAI